MDIEGFNNNHESGGYPVIYYPASQMQSSGTHRIIGTDAQPGPESATYVDHHLAAVDAAHGIFVNPEWLTTLIELQPNEFAPTYAPPRQILPYHLIYQINYIIEILESRVAFDASTRFLSTEFPLSYEQIHRLAFSEILSPQGVAIYRHHNPNYRPTNEYCLDMRAEVGDIDPRYLNSDIKIYKSYKWHFKWNNVLIDVLEELGIRPLDWMMVQRMKLYPPFNLNYSVRIESKEWVNTVKRLFRNMAPPCICIPRETKRSLWRLVHQGMKLYTQETDALEHRISGDVFQPLRDAMSGLSLV